MAKAAAAKLTSEERCLKAWRIWVEPLKPHLSKGEHDYMEWAWNACWRHLQGHVAEFIEN